MGSKKKRKIIKVVAPQHVSRSAPLVISFGKWQDELPRDVTIELVELDRKNSSDDNLTTSEDLVASFTGTLTASEDGESATLEGISLQTVASPARCSDRVWLRFANQSPADVVEAGIPYSPRVAPPPEDEGSGKKAKKKKKGKPEEFSANEGSFYELAARVRDGHDPGGEQIVLSGATVVRQRAFVLVAVEPLSQNDSSMKHDVGKRILETYHPKETKKHQPRNWGDCVIRFRRHEPMMIGESGCSYVIVAMLLRYLRVDVPSPEVQEGEATLVPEDLTAGLTARLWDTKIHHGELSSHPDCKPWWSVKAFNPDVEKWLAVCDSHYGADRNAFIEHFQALGEAEAIKKKAMKSLLKSAKASFKKKAKAHRGFALVEPPVSVDHLTYFEERSISETSYLPLLVWHLNVYDGRTDGYAMQRHELQEYELQLTGESDYTALPLGEEHKGYEAWVPEYKATPLICEGEQALRVRLVAEGTKGQSATNSKGVLVPMSGGLQKHFGLASTAPIKLVNEFPSDTLGDPELTPWQRFVVETLNRGLPIVGLFSPGQYSLRDLGGHFCLIVGYRFRRDPLDGAKKEVRFIINDPAGGRTFQYEAHDERELNPEGVDPSAKLKEKEKGMERERCGLNLILDRRMRLSLREIRVYEPANKARESVWDASRHARFLFFQGGVQDGVD